MVIDIDKFQFLIPRRPDGRVDEVYLLFSNKSQQEIESMSGKMRRNKQAKKVFRMKNRLWVSEKIFPMIFIVRRNNKISGIAQCSIYSP